jgi:hypothetical protein
MSKTMVSVLCCLFGCLIAFTGCDRKPKKEASTEPSASEPGKDAATPGTRDATAVPGMDPKADPGADPMADPGMDPMADPGMDPMADPGMDPMAEAPQPMPILAAKSCAGKGKQLTKTASAASFKREGNVWTRKETWGGGCPKGPVFTLVYQPKTKPLAVRLCFDPSKDTCESVRSGELRWDLTAALKEAGATDVKWVD